MVKGRTLPGGRAMTRSAICSKLSVVFIIAAVTGIAVLRRAFIHAILMAVCAGHVDMRTRQFKDRQIVVKGCALPGGCAVARSAIRTELSIVFIIVTVTGIAILRRAFEGSILVTVRTGQTAMRPC